MQLSTSMSYLRHVCLLSIQNSSTGQINRTCYYKYVIVSAQEFERDGIRKRFLANETYMEDSLMFSIAPL